MSPTSLPAAPPAPRPPAITPHAQPSAVVVNFTTLLTIQNFSQFYPGASPDSFQPVYYTLPDGSLLAPPLLDDLRANDVFLIITGSLLFIFLRNICKAAVYLRRSNVKNKGLFYTLFFSQLLGPIAIIPLIVAQFSTSTNCAFVLRIVYITSGLSLSLLITGILGVKAYRCLDNNIFVLGSLIALRSAASVVLILDVVKLDSFRTLSGRCCSTAGLSSVFMVLLLTESFVICICFFYAMRKSHKSLAARSSISVRHSFDDVAHNQLNKLRKQTGDSVRNRGGLFGPPVDDVLMSSTTQQPSTMSQEPSIVSIRRDGSQSIATFNDIPDDIQSEHTIPFPSMAHSHSPPDHWSVRMPATSEGSNLPHSVTAPYNRPASVALSSASCFTRHLPRLSLFREVMRDELCYTAIITAFTVVSAAMTLIGVKSAGGINANIWISFDWALISILVMHSFGRVIRRHENESLLHYSSTWHHDLHTDRITAKLLRDIPPPMRTPEVLSRTRLRRSVPRIDTSGVPPSDHSLRDLFPGSVHSFAVSTSCTSNTSSRVESDSLCAPHLGRPHVDGRRVFPASIMEDLSPGLLHPQGGPEEWFDKNLTAVAPPPEPPDV